MGMHLYNSSLDRDAGRQRDQGGALGAGGLRGGRQGLSGSDGPNPVCTYTFISIYINRITNLMQHSFLACARSGGLASPTRTDECCCSAWRRRGL